MQWKRNSGKLGEKQMRPDTFAIIYAIVRFALAWRLSTWQPDWARWGLMRGGEAPAPKMRQTFYALAYFTAFGIANAAP